MVDAQSKSQRQLAALERFVAANKALDEQGIEPLTDEFFAIINSGISINSEKAAWDRYVSKSLAEVEAVKDDPSTWISVDEFWENT